MRTEVRGQKTVAVALTSAFCPSNPELDAIAQLGRQLRLDHPTHLLRVIARSQVSADDQLILKTIGSLQEVVQVHVAELVDLLPPMIGPDKAQLGDEDLGLVDRGIGVQT